MDIAVVNQAGVRKHFYEFPSDVGAALVHAGVAVQIAKAAPAPKPEARWYVGHTPTGAKKDYVLIWTDGNGAVMYFNAPPATYLVKPPVWCGLAAPLAVLEQYARLVAGMPDADWVMEQQLRQQGEEAMRQQKERELTAQYNRG